MLIRSGSLTRPSPLVEFDCGSQSTSSVFTSAAASEAARLIAVVVFPTPPFWLAIAMTRPIAVLCLCPPEYAEATGEINARVLCKVSSVSRETQDIPDLRAQSHPSPGGQKSSPNPGSMFHVKH